MSVSLLRCQHVWRVVAGHTQCSVCQVHHTEQHRVWQHLRAVLHSLHTRCLPMRVSSNPKPEPCFRQQPTAGRRTQRRPT